MINANRAQVVDTDSCVPGEEEQPEQLLFSFMREDLSQLRALGGDDLGLELELALSSQYRS